MKNLKRLLTPKTIATSPTRRSLRTRTRILFTFGLLALVVGLASESARMERRGLRAEAGGQPRGAGAVWLRSGIAAMPALSGTKTICPSGCDYASLTAAITNVRASGFAPQSVYDIPISSYTSSPSPDALYPDTGGTELKDGLFGDPANFNDQKWTAWQTGTPTLTFDLGNTKTVGGMTVHYMYSTLQAVSTIHAPASAVVTGSTDGVNYASIGTFSGTTVFPQPGGNSVVTATLNFPANATVRFVRITLTRSTQWLFLDEVTIFVPHPLIAVEQPAGTSVADGGSIHIGRGNVGGRADVIFTIRNTGTADLTEFAFTFDGADASEFSVVSSPTSPIPLGGSANFTVRFAPLVKGHKTAALHIASNVTGATNPYDINLNAIGVSGQISGTQKIGPTGDYPSIGAALLDLQTSNYPGALVLELQAAYASGVETFPLNFSNLGTSALNTVTLRPETGATNLLITSADATATVDLNGANFVTFDGRAGGAGTAKQLTIENTNTSGSAIRFINEASNNTVKYVALKGVTTSPSSGVVFFSTTTGASGNDNNTIDNCNIGDGATTPTNALYSAGSTGTAAQNNSGNTVSNSNIFNFYASLAAAMGVKLDPGSTDWTITGNSFYQTATRPAVAQAHRVIYVNNTSGNNYTVTNNSIGGSQPNAGGTAWTTSDTTAAYQFLRIHLNVGTTTPSSVQGNTIKNFVWTTSSNANTLPGVWSGIYVQAGSVNVGTTTGNTIGSATGTGSISVTTSGNGGFTFGIASASGAAVNISNNIIGSITTNAAASSASASLVGIQVTAGTNTISNNTVGSTTTANSLNAATSLTNAGQGVTGIFSSSTGGATITNNTVANLNNNYAGTTNVSANLRGIATSSGANTIIGNTVRNLSTASGNNNSTTAQSVYGIIQTSTTAGQTVSQNVVHSLSNTHASAAVSVTGIYFAGSTTTAATIARNLVHSLSVSSSGTAVMNGMQFAAGTFTAQNNMVRVGLDASGNSTAGASSVRGISDGGTTAGRNFYHNSVYLGGTQTSGASNTFAFTSAGATNARTYQNNIFVNARTNGGGTGKHYAVSYGGTTVNPTGLTANGNIFYVSGTGGVLGRYNSADQTMMQAWRSATGQDSASGFADPLFVNPTGDASAVDLHLQASNPAEANVIAVASVTDDFDGETRSGLTPTDIGADAGNFTLSSDAIPPAISYPLLSNGSTSNRTLTGWATIADNVGVSGGANSPRLYFKKSTDADAFAGNTSADNGWKYVTPTNATSPFTTSLAARALWRRQISLTAALQVRPRPSRSRRGNLRPAATPTRKRAIRAAISRPRCSSIRASAICTSSRRAIRSFQTPAHQSAALRPTTMAKPAACQRPTLARMSLAQATPRLRSLLKPAYPDNKAWRRAIRKSPPSATTKQRLAV